MVEVLIQIFEFSVCSFEICNEISLTNYGSPISSVDRNYGYCVSELIK